MNTPRWRRWPLSAALLMACSGSPPLSDASVDVGDAATADAQGDAASGLDVPLTDAVITDVSDTDAVFAEVSVTDVVIADANVTDVEVATDVDDTDVGTADVSDTDVVIEDAGVTDVHDTDDGIADVGVTDVHDTDLGIADVGVTDVHDTDVGIADASDTDAGDTDATVDDDASFTDAGTPLDIDDDVIDATAADAADVVTGADSATDGGAVDAGCARGYAFVDGACVVIAAPRPVAPLSLGDVTLRRPTLRWALPPGVDGAVVQLCRDRACGFVIETLRVTGTSARPTSPLPERSVVFWKLRGRVGEVDGLELGPTWIFHVPARDNAAGVDTSRNPHLDVNGDGYDDLAVTASGAFSGAGAVYVFHGGPGGVSTAASRTLRGMNTSDFFGATACAGDVNGDGYADLIVGAPGYDNLYPSAGIARVYHGGATGLSETSSWSTSGSSPSERRGGSVAGAGDVNGDGYADIVVGAPGRDPAGRADAGVAYVFQGSATGVQTASSRELQGLAAGDQFGSAVAGAGDVNGDGLGDVVVGAPEARLGGPSWRGAAYVFHGTSAGISTTAAFDAAGVGVGDRFGSPVSGGGDLDGDGYDDVVISAPARGVEGRLVAGAVYAFHGGAAGVSRTFSAEVIGEATSDALGTSLSAGRDLNGDGFADVAVGSPSSDRRLTNAGAAFVFHGGAGGMQTSPAVVLTGRFANDGFGQGLSIAADLNGDGFADLASGSIRYAGGGRVEAGAAWVYPGGVTGVASTYTRELVGAEIGIRFGSPIASFDPGAPRLRACFARVAMPTFPTGA